MFNGIIKHTGKIREIYKNNNNSVIEIQSKIKFSKNDKQLALLPFGHTASINYNILHSFMVGCDLYISKGFEYLRSNSLLH